MTSRIISNCITAAALVGLLASNVSAQSTKTAVGMFDNPTSGGVTLSILPGQAQPTGMESVIHIAQQKDVHVDISLQCGLATDTTVKSKGKNLRADVRN